MSYNKEIENLLSIKNIQKTAMRILVLQFFLEQKSAISLPQLEENFYYSERTTLYRTLKTFEDKALVHKINDGTSSTKYAICKTTCEANDHTDIHPHFYCEKCETTTCVNSILIPKLSLPNFKISSSELIIKGICDVCNKVA